MRRYRAAAWVGALVLIGAWWLWPSPGDHSQEQPARVGSKRAKRVVTPLSKLKPPALDAVAAPPLDEWGPEVPVDGLLMVDVVDERGRPAEHARVWIRGCRFEPRGWQEFRLIEGVCSVHAGRRDGALWTQAEPAQILAGTQDYVQLELPSARTGGLGVSVKPDPDGIRVVAVHPNTPAYEMGLEVGDLIIEVDGYDTRELGLQEFIRTMTGAEGTEVDFVVEFDTEEGPAVEPLSIVRRYLETS